MNTAVDKLFIDAASNKHLDWLESEAIHIMREVAAECTSIPDTTSTK
jgi:sulfate adenylyltransferase subunit 2